MAGRRGKAAAEPTAYQRALGLLVRREHSRKELTRKLQAKGLDADEAEAALDVLSRQDFQNDDRFAEALARTRASSGYGPMRIRAELAMHNLPRETLLAALEACDRDWLALARDLISRRYARKNLDDPAQRRKAIDFLLRRGFDQRTAMSSVRPARGEDENEGDDQR